MKIYKAKSALQIPIESNSRSKKEDSKKTGKLLGEYLESWFAIHKRKLAPSTINGYYTNIYNHIIPAIGKLTLEEIKPSSLDKFYLDLMDNDGLSAKTVTYVHNVLKVALRAAVEDDLIPINPCMRVKPPKVPKFRSTLLSKEQLSLLFAFLDGNRYETEIKLAAMLGLRRGEVLGLKFSDWNMREHTLHIQRQVSVVRDKTSTAHTDYYGLKPLKSESSERVLCISEDVEQLLLKKKEYNQAQKERLGEYYEDNDLICCKEDGTFLSPQTLYHAFKRIIRDCGLPDMRFHDLRHSYATLCIDLNIPIKVISQSLGHSSAAVTDLVYANSITARQQLADVVSKAINGTGKEKSL